MNARDAAEQQVCEAARANGRSWARIGIALGVSKQAAPERGECGYDEATVHLQEMIGGEQITLATAGPSTDNRDAYDRLLRYVDQGDMDAGYEQIAAGLAIARYYSRDGYGAHDREAEYIAADDATGRGYQCQEPEPEPEPPAEPEPESEPEPPAVEPWNQPGPDLDCGDIGHVVFITGTDYHRLDADGGGVGSESYG